MPKKSDPKNQAEPLKLNVAPHLVQDLGLNLYTDLPKVLVEYVANAYDADSPFVDIVMDFVEIEKQRAIVKATATADKAKAAGVPEALAAIPSMGERTLPLSVTVKISDRGCGMSRDDLATQFLIAGRRRREEGPAPSTHTSGGRLLMGRKGVGKLAGFGVAQVITITTRKRDARDATRIVLDYHEIGKHRTTNDIVVPESTPPGGGGIPITGGTEVVLSCLMHDPLKTKQDTVENALTKQFWQVAQGGFKINLNGRPISGDAPEYKFAWPRPELPHDQLVSHSIAVEDDREYQFLYRLRFRKDSLMAAERGVRIYAHARLASAPSLLDVPTGMHGFRQSDYLDGIVQADFIDEQPTDYIATDRQSLRWETPLLGPLRKFLSEEMKNAIVECQKVMDGNAEKEARDDIYTNDLIAKASLPKHRARAVHKMAAVLASICKGGTEGQEYKERIGILVSGVEQGDILSELHKLSREAVPNFTKVVEEVTELTKQEFGDFGRYLRGRLSAIDALANIIGRQDFALGKNEKELHVLLENNAWLIDPALSQFLTSNQTQDVTFKKLAAELGVGSGVPADPDSGDERPDLVFLLHNTSLNRLLIVELKAPNVKLNMEHLLQLRDYVRDARTWLKNAGREHVIVESILIGSRSKAVTTSKNIKRLEDELTRKSPSDDERVYDLNELLDRTKRAHVELLSIHRQQTNT